MRHDSVAPLAFGVSVKATVPKLVGTSRTATTWPALSHDGEIADMSTMPLPSSRTSMLRSSVTYSAAHQPCGTVVEVDRPVPERQQAGLERGARRRRVGELVVEAVDHARCSLRTSWVSSTRKPR